MAKYSKQREAIYEYLISHRNHPRAEKIFADLKPDNPTLSLATVYRNLKMFQAYNKVQIINSNDGAFCYDADVSQHYHFECRKCSVIYDIPSKQLPSCILESTGNIGEVERYSLVFYGLCNNCINKNK